MDLQNTLFNIGFNKKEARVYLAALELGGTTITNIAQKAGLPRTTTYGIIKMLSQKGLLSFNIKKRRKYFFSEDPIRLLTITQEKERLLKEALPRLESINNISIVKPKIKFYEGKEGIKTILEDILKTKRDFLAITSIHDMMRMFKDYFPRFIQKRIARKIRVKLLTNRTPESLRFAKKDKWEFRQTKFVPQEFSFHTANFIYNNKVVILSVKKRPVTGIVIEDSDVTYTQEMLFKIIWGNKN